MLSSAEMEQIYANMSRVEHSNVPVSKIKRAPADRKNPRDNAKAVPVVAKSLRDFGYVKTSITVDEDFEILTGDTTFQAHLWNDNLRKNEPGLEEQEYERAESRFDGPDWKTVLQVTQVIGMPEWMKRAYRISDNKSHEFADWVPEMVIRDIEFIMEKKVNPNVTSFSPRELSLLVKSVPDLTKDREISPTRADTIEDYEKESVSGSDEELEDEPDSYSERETGSDSCGGDDDVSWVVHFAFSTKTAAEDFARSNGFELKFPPNCRILSIDMSDME